MSKKGFTLIEMAIVLVIIGIILGMVMKGRELVQGAKTKSFIVDVKNLENIQYVFFDRFGRFAGDCDKDGLVDFDGTTTTFSNSTAELCQDDTSLNNADAAYSELKAAGLLSNEGNSEHAQIKNGFGTVYFAQKHSTNIILLDAVPCSAAISLDASIDKTTDGKAGRIRAGDAGTSDWETACPNLNSGTTSIVYYYDNIP